MATSRVKYRQQLNQLADKYQRDVSSVEEQARHSTGGQADGGLSNVPMHLADLGTDVILQETSSVLLENERYLLNEVLSALKRLDDGSFGRCDNCGEQIGETRLEAIPYARQCIRCATKFDQGPPLNLNSGRPQRGAAMVTSDDDSRAKRQRRRRETTSLAESEIGLSHREDDIHAVGTAGGGTALGGLAGTNIGRGDPLIGDLERATGSGEFDAADRRDVEISEASSEKITGESKGAPIAKGAGAKGKTGGLRPRAERKGPSRPKPR